MSISLLSYLKSFNILEREKFDWWYVAQKDKQYVFRDAIYKYCVCNVDILQKGCVIFSHLIHEKTGLLPFYNADCITIASLALKVFKSKFLKKNKLSLLPETGYRGNVNKSLVALCWLSKINKSVTIDVAWSLCKRIF